MNDETTQPQAIVPIETSQPELYGTYDPVAERKETLKFRDISLMTYDHTCPNEVVSFNDLMKGERELELEELVDFMAYIAKRPSKVKKNTFESIFMPDYMRN